MTVKPITPDDVVGLKKSERLCLPRYNGGKYVRKDHVRTIKHWAHGQIMENNLMRRPEIL